MKYKLSWITPEIKRQMRKKHRSHKKALRYQNPDHSFQELLKNLVVIT